MEQSKQGKELHAVANDQPQAVIDGEEEHKFDEDAPKVVDDAQADIDGKKEVANNIYLN